MTYRLLVVFNMAESRILLVRGVCDAPERRQPSEIGTHNHWQPSGDVVPAVGGKGLGKLGRPKDAVVGHKLLAVFPEVVAHGAEVRRGVSREERAVPEVDDDLGPRGREVVDDPRAVLLVSLHRGLRHGRLDPVRGGRFPVGRALVVKGEQDVLVARGVEVEAQAPVGGIHLRGDVLQGVGCQRHLGAVLVLRHDQADDGGEEGVGVIRAAVPAGDCLHDRGSFGYARVKRGEVPEEAVVVVRGGHASALVGAHR